MRHGSSSELQRSRGHVTPLEEGGGRVWQSDSFEYIGHFAKQSAVWMDETTKLRMQFAGRLHPLQRAPVELHDTSRERRRCGAIQCTSYSQVIHAADGESASPSVNQSVSQSATSRAGNRPRRHCRKMIEELLTWVCCVALW